MAQAQTSRFFCLVTYEKDTSVIIRRLVELSSRIRSYALICHDKDEADVHHHIVLRTFASRKPLDVAKWFDFSENTFAQICHDRQGAVDYLTHKDSPVEKYIYSQDAVIDGGIADILPRSSSADESFEIVQALLDGASVRDLCRLYGRDFIYHYSSYLAVVEAINRQERT